MEHLLLVMMTDEIVDEVLTYVQDEESKVKLLEWKESEDFMQKLGGIGDIMKVCLSEQQLEIKRQLD